MPPPQELKLAVALRGLRRILFLLTVLCCAISCSCCTQEQLKRNDVVSVCFPSFGYEVWVPGSRLQASWDAGVIDGALHLTTDDVYKPPVYYPPDVTRSAGNVMLWSKIELWRPLGTDGVWHEASFNTTFTMSANRSREGDGGGLMFEILSSAFTERFDRATYFSLASASNYLSDGRRVPVEIGRLGYYYHPGTTGLYVSIAPAPNASSANYTVWIDYNAVVHNLSVYVVEDGKPKPGQATLHAPVNLRGIVSSPFHGLYFGLFASKNRLLPSCQVVVYSWNLTVDRLPGMGGQRRRRWLAMLLPSLLVVVIAVVVFVAACYFASRYRALKMKLKLSEALRQLPGVPREFKHATIRKATHNFHEAMKLGKGGFGAVYKGTLRSGKRGDVRVEVAVKKFTRKEDRGYDDFLAEVDIINRLRHKNIVPLVGWCYEKGELLLIYEYMPNGSLEQHLFRENHHHQPTLRWETRYDIVKDVAAGLHYVHHEYERAVLHRDIKASNILLDSAFRGRLGDFGLARVVSFDKNSYIDFGVAGTWGFIAPEYPVSHKATRQTDVYAFGVLVLEVVTSKRSLSAADAAFLLLTDWVWWLHREGRLLEAVDGDLTAPGEFDLDDATRLLLLGLACSNPNPSDRPTMVEVVQIVAKSAVLPVVPLVKPTFVWPPEGELPFDDLIDDFVGLAHDDSGRSYSKETSSRQGVTTNNRESEITKRRCRNVAEPNITGYIESFV